VHRTEIEEFYDGDQVRLKDGTILRTDAAVLCTGWTENLGLFDEATRVQYGLPSAADQNQQWKDLDALADEIVLEKLPLLKHSPDTFNAVSTVKPWRLYRRMISPVMAAKNDRSIFFPGQIHSVYTPLVGEMQALWGVAFMLGKLDLPSEADMIKEVAISCAWTRRR
jgi:dimethylaniline monooxygenase (N-oxide forming)